MCVCARGCCRCPRARPPRLSAVFDKLTCAGLRAGLDSEETEEEESITSERTGSSLSLSLPKMIRRQREREVERKGGWMGQYFESINAQGDS